MNDIYFDVNDGFEQIKNSMIFHEIAEARMLPPVFTYLLLQNP